MIVKELMTTDPVTVRTHTTVKAALALLDEDDITSLPVVTTDGQICGIVSEADLIRDLVGADPRLHPIPASTNGRSRPQYVTDVMSRYSVTVRPETDVALAVEVVTSTGVKSLPVVDADDRVVGMLSRRDVVRALARADGLLEQEIDGLLVSAGFGDWIVDVHDGAVEISGPTGRHEHALAEAIAGSVTGVVEVRVE